MLSAQSREFHKFFRGFFWEVFSAKFRIFFAFFLFTHFHKKMRSFAKKFTKYERKFSHLLIGWGYFFWGEFHVIVGQT